MNGRDALKFGAATWLILLSGAAIAQAPNMKMTTDIPPSLVTPDTVETRIGTLKFTDGFPDAATVEKVYDNLDFQRGVQAYLAALPAVSIEASEKVTQTLVLSTRLCSSRSSCWMPSHSF
jgi:hypothetical protein